MTIGGEGRGGNKQTGMNMLILLPLFLIVSIGSCHKRPMTRPLCLDDSCDSDPALRWTIADLQTQLGICRKDLSVTQIEALVAEGVIKDLYDKLEAKEEECEGRVEEETRNLTDAMTRTKNELTQAKAMVMERDQMIALLQAALSAQTSSIMADDQVGHDSNNVTFLRESIKKIADSITTASELFSNLLNQLSTSNAQTDSASNTTQSIGVEQSGMEAQVQELVDAMMLVGMEVADLKEKTGRLDFVQSLCAKNA